MQIKNSKKILSILLGSLIFFQPVSQLSLLPVLAEEPSPSPSATPAQEVTSIKFVPNPSSAPGFDETFDNSGKTDLPKNYSYTSASSTVGYTVSKISLVGQAVRDGDEVTALGNLTLGKVEGQKEDNSWVVLADFGNSATATETIGIDEEENSLDTTTTFKAIKYSGLVDNSTGLTVNSYDSSELKLEVEFMPVVKHKVTFIDDNTETTIGYANAPDGFDLVESTAPVKTHTGYTFDALIGTTTNITADEEIHITYAVNQYDVKIHYNSIDLVDDKYDYGTKFTVLKKDTTTDKEFTLDENGIDEELVPLAETGFIFKNWSYDDTTRTITPNYDVETFTVTFVDLDNKPIGTPETVEYGKSATAPEAPVVEGYSFTRWDVDFSNVTSDLTVKPVYDQIMLQVYITCNSAILIDEKLPWGSTISILNGDKTLNKKIEVKQDINQDLPVPEFLGHTFSNYTPTDDGAGNKTLTPNFVVNEYSIRFLGMDKNVLTTKRVKYGETVVAPDAPVVKGYIFTGWDKPLTGITADEDIIACYNDDPSVNKYNVTFVVRTGDTSYGTLSNATGLINSFTKEKVIEGTLVSSFAPDARVVGTSKFLGWYINGVKEDHFDTRQVDAIMTLEARFFPDINANDIDDREEPVVVKFNTVGGSSVSEQTIYVGSVVQTPSTPTKSGYIFAGWYTTNSYATKWSFGDAFTQDTTLVAKWNKIVVPTTPAPLPTATPVATKVPTIVATPTVTSSATSSTTSSTTSTTLNTSGLGGNNSLTSSTARPVVTINPTLYIRPTITFHSFDSFLEGKETMPYGTNIYVVDGHDNIIAEYSARQDCDILLEEPSIIKEKVFSGYRIYWENGAVIVKYEYITDRSSDVNSTPASATPTITVDSQSKGDSGDWKWMIPYIAGAVGIIGLFAFILIKVLKKDSAEEEEAIANSETEDAEGDSETEGSSSEETSEKDFDSDENQEEISEGDEEENPEEDEEHDYDYDDDGDGMGIPFVAPTESTRDYDYTEDDSKQDDSDDEKLEEFNDADDKAIEDAVQENQADVFQFDGVAEESTEQEPVAGIIVNDLETAEPPAEIDNVAQESISPSAEDTHTDTVPAENEGSEKQISQVEPEVNKADVGTVSEVPTADDKYEALLNEFRSKRK